MGTITINGKKYEFTNEKNVLTIIRNAGIEVPTLCYQPELSIFGACRLCTVEDDRGRCFASCSEEPRDGMVIFTHTERLRKHRKLIVELLLAAHCRDCTTCDKHGKCKLQKLAYQLGINQVRFENHREIMPVDFSSPAIVRDPNKCILCGNCVRACTELQGIGVLGFAHRGTDAVVTPAFDRRMAATNCVGCGQCRVVCPTGALTIHHNMTEVWQALGDKNTRVVAQIAPAVRVALGEAFGLPKGENAMGKIVAALHRMGFDQVFDTSYTADLTIMAVLKEYYRDEKHAQGKKTMVVSIMPCTAKKMEAKREDYRTYGEQDTDAVLTTTELIRMIDAHGINFETLPSEACDMPFGIGSGGGVIFGTTGGVTEAVLRRLCDDEEGPSLDAIADCGVRGEEGIREFIVPYKGMEVRMCVASGLENARKVLDAVKSGEKSYHFIEVMACPGGCVMGGGQPIYGTKATRVTTRRAGLYAADGNMAIKKSNENPLMDVFYNGPFKDKTHELLHTSHHE